MKAQCSCLLRTGHGRHHEPQNRTAPLRAGPHLKFDNCQPKCRPNEAAGTSESKRDSNRLLPFVVARVQIPGLSFAYRSSLPFPVASSRGCCILYAISYFIFVFMLSAKCCLRPSPPLAPYTCTHKFIILSSCFYFDLVYA